MKINSIPPGDAISKYLNAAKSSPGKHTVSSGVDSVELSEGARQFAALTKAAKESMEKTNASEKEKAAELEKRISAGAYHVSSRDVAGSILGGPRTIEE
jgi:anti-sigma28 factor (negative regulator of flagellin synthesis)